MISIIRSYNRHLRLPVPSPTAWPVFRVEIIYNGSPRGRLASKQLPIFWRSEREALVHFLLLFHFSFFFFFFFFLVIAFSYSSPHFSLWHIHIIADMSTVAAPTLLLFRSGVEWPLLLLPLLLLLLHLLLHFIRVSETKVNIHSKNGNS